MDMDELELDVDIALDTILDAIDAGLFTALCESIPINYFEAVGVFYAFMDSKPCWQREPR